LGQVFKKVLFSIKDGDVLHRVGRNFSVKVENKTLLLHGFENGVVNAVVFNTGIAVRSDSSRVRFHTWY